MAMFIDILLGARENFSLTKLFVKYNILGKGGERSATKFAFLSWRRIVVPEFAVRCGVGLAAGAGADPVVERQLIGTLSYGTDA